jgi:PRTRC genetic system protein B
MNERTEALLKKYKPVVAIMVYSGDRNDYYLESHDINDKGQILEGKPLKQETLDGIVDTFFDERQNRVQMGGLIPENVLRFSVLPGGKYVMSWFRPAEQRQLFFNEKLHIPSGQAWVPAMVYTVSGNDLFVFALRESVRPAETTKLYQAPFHNVSSSGKVCLGNAKVKKPEKNTYSNIMKYWEDLFWLSEFTHLAGGSNPTKSNLNIIWKRMVEENFTAFPVKELVVYDKHTLNDLL